jgi:Short-chain dehydrogenases of various substrate specificities
VLKKVAVITGGSGGIGKAVARRFLQGGYIVYELSRKGKDADGIIHLTADVTDPAAVEASFAKVYKAQGRIDIVVSNAGFGISGATEFTPIEEAKRLFDVNFFGMAASAKTAIPYLRETKGRIISTSSAAGAIPIPFQSYYSASKAAINALCEAIRCEVRPFGVTACCVLPGDVKTGFTEARDKDHAGDDVYQGRIERSVSTMEKDEQNGMTPEYVANNIFRIAQKKSVRPFYTIGFGYILLSFFARALPRSLVNRLVGMIYAK